MFNEGDICVFSKGQGTGIPGGGCRVNSWRKWEELKSTRFLLLYSDTIAKSEIKYKVI